MRRDSIFYKLFKQSPSLLFELVDSPPTTAANYQFESVEVKSELSLFLHRHPIRYPDWSGVIIFGSRNLEPLNLRIHRSLLSGEQIRRVYLDELGDVQQQPLGLGLMLLTIKEGTEAIDTAKFLLEQAQAQSEVGIIDLITTIIVYKFKNLSREEVITMLGLDLEEPRAIREAKEEGLLEGRKQEAISLVLRLLNRRFGKIPEQCLSQAQKLSLSQIEVLAEDLLDFSTVADLERWLESHLT